MTFLEVKIDFIILIYVEFIARIAIRHGPQKSIIHGLFRLRASPSMVRKSVRAILFRGAKFGFPATSKMD